MDYYERTLYNDILGSQDPNDSRGGVTYFVPLNPGAKRSFASHGTCCHRSCARQCWSVCVRGGVSRASA